jgi:hypothetical protein
MRFVVAKASICSVVALATIRTASAQLPERVGTELQVNTYTSGRQLLPGVLVEPDGDFLIVWSGYQGTAKASIFGQRYSSAGARLAAEFQTTPTPPTPTRPRGWRPPRGAASSSPGARSRTGTRTASAGGVSPRPEHR